MRLLTKKYSWIIIFLMFGTGLKAQLLVIPKLGAYIESVAAHDDSFVETKTSYSGLTPQAGLEISMGITNAWAVGLDYSFSLQNRETQSRIEDFDVKDVSYRSHDFAVRAKYAMMDMFFLNGGISFSWLESIEHTVFEFMGNSKKENTPSAKFIGPHIGAEFVYRRIVIGGAYTYGLGVAYDGSNQLGFAASRQKVELYAGYLFNLRVLKNDPWEKKCPKF